jgi:hypothetical protein
MIPEGRVGITWHPVEFTSFFPERLRPVASPIFKRTYNQQVLG